MKHTSCKDCYFAQYEGITQVGCKMGKIDKYKKIAQVVEAYDHQKEFYVIKDRVCNTYNPFKDIPVEEAIELSKLQYDIFVLAKYDHYLKNKGQIEKTLESAKISLPPRKIYVIWDGPESDELKQLVLKHGIFVQLLKKSTLSEMEFELTHQSKSFFYVPLLAGDKLNEDTILGANSEQNDKLTEFVLYKKNGQEVILRSAYVNNPAPRGDVLNYFKEILPNNVIEA